MIIEPFILNVEEMNVYGLKKLPYEKNNKLVVMFHGFTGNHIETNRLFPDLERRLLAENIGTLRFDYRYHGDSDGDFEDFTLSSALKDAEHVMEYLYSDTRINSERIGVVGLSLGGAVAIYTSSRYNIKTLVLWSAVGKGWLNDKLKMVEEAKDKDFIYWGAYRLKKEGMKDIANFDIGKYIPKIKATTLIIHSKDDVTVKPSDAEYTYRLLNSKKKIILMEKGGHAFFDYKTKERVLDETVKWLNMYL